jgi:hypothetical protein
MEDWILRVLRDLSARLDGPMHFRFIMQPAMSIFFATRDGIRDARAQHSPWFWSVCTDPVQRRSLLIDCWKSVGKVFLFAILLDVIYQIVEFHRFYLFETLLTAFLLALFPYVVLRGPINRIARRWRRKGDAPPVVHSA